MHTVQNLPYPFIPSSSCKSNHRSLQKPSQTKNSHQPSRKLTGKISMQSSPAPRDTSPRAERATHRQQNSLALARTTADTTATAVLTRTRFGDDCRRGLVQPYSHRSSFPLSPPVYSRSPPLSCSFLSLSSLDSQRAPLRNMYTSGVCIYQVYTVPNLRAAFFLRIVYTSVGRPVFLDFSAPCCSRREANCERARAL